MVRRRDRSLLPPVVVDDRQPLWGPAAVVRIAVGGRACD
jgi:hypothetical protein